MDRDQEKAYQLAMEGKNLFISGMGGCGKSYIAKKIISDLRNQGKRVEVAAPAQMAALGLDGRTGRTVHRLFNTYPGGEHFDREGLKRLSVSPACKADVIVIDEISMCRADFFSYIHHAWQMISQKNGERIQVIVLGDFYQLPPVDKYRKEPEYAFESDCWEKSGFYYIMCSTPHRFGKDLEFFRWQEQIREGKNSQEAVRWLKENAHFMEFCPDAVTLCARRCDADKINRLKIEELPGAAVVYPAICNRPDMPADLPCLKKLVLKKGAAVMAVRNDPGGAYCNGSQGTVVAMEKDSITVDFFRHGDCESHVICSIPRTLWSSPDSENPEDGVIQFPLIPAYAMTVHRVQGMTLNRVNIIPRSFAPGQFYVAVSRVRSVEGLYIPENFTEEVIKTCPRVNEFYCRNFQIKKGA